MRGNEFLEAVLINQFTNGCSRVVCNNAYCARCSSFKFMRKSRQEREQLARQIARQSDGADVLCDNIPYLLGYPEKKEDIGMFVNLANNVVDGQRPPVKVIVLALRRVFLDVDLLGLVLMSNDKALNRNNSSINDDFVADFAGRLSSWPVLNAPLLNCVYAAANALKDAEPTYPIIRAMLLLFYFPAVLAPECTDTLLNPLLMKICDLSEECLLVTVMWLCKLPRLLQMYIGAVHFSLSQYFSMHDGQDPHTPAVFRILEAFLVAVSANEHAENPLPPSVFYNHHIDEAVTPQQELSLKMNTRRMHHSHTNVGPMSFLSMPFVLSIKTKSQICQIESQQLMNDMAIASLLEGALRRRHSSDLFLTIRVRRSHILDDAVSQLMAQNPASFLKKLKVVFEGESAVDVGGPSREFLYLTAEKLFSPDLGMFVVANGRFNWFSPISFEGERSYFLVGAVVGIAIHNSVVLPIRFPLLVYKRLMTPNQKLTLTDLAEIDPQLSSSLASIRDMVEREEDVSQLGLTFDAVLDCWGEPRMFPILDGMSGVEVTNANAQLYIDAYIYFLLVKVVEARFEAFRRGFLLATKATTYRLLEPAEIDILVSGEEVMDWGALQRSARYKDGYKPTSRAVRWFWEIFSDFSHERKLKFLKFATGTDRSPLGGLGNVKLVLQRGADPNRLPISHTCFNTFTLPDYRSKSVMRKKIIMAIEQTEGFGIV